MKGRYNGINNPFFGKTHSIETIEKLKKPKSNQHKEKLRKILTEKPKVVCIHCNKLVDELNARRWHFDNCLLNHPSIDQVVTFAVKHKTLGEDVAAAIVLKPGAEITEQEIKTWARQRLSSFKVPKQIILVDSIPKGSTGKVQRIGLADKLGLE